MKARWTAAIRRITCKISTSDRRYVGRVKRSRPDTIDYSMDPADTEIDNHADTHCFGKNFKPLHFTSEVCTVSPFLDEYSEQPDIPICSAATALDLQNGETLILIFGQGLWFGNRMSKSLINPNQCRAYGVAICDDPTDPHRELGFHLGDDEILPLEMRGSTCGMTTRAPTNNELETCRNIYMSDEQHWDPNDATFHRMISSLGGGKRYSADPSIMAVDTNKFIYRNDSNIYEYDRAMSQISTGFTPGLMIESMQNSVNISATYSGERHHGTDPHLLARKWGIGLNKAKQTLECTTQQNIRSAILPLTRRYRTDLLSQRLRRLSSRFFTDTAFAKEASILGNTCAQIFTDGDGFVMAIPMKSKAEAGEKLHVFCKDVGIPNELHMDNAPEMIGPNSLFQKVCKEKMINCSTIEPHSPWQNKCENIIGVIKTKAKGRRIRRRIPKQLWDFGIVWECEIYSRTANREGTTGMQRLTGDTTDISEWIDFEFYDLVKYWDDRSDENKSSIGRWLGVSHHVGSALCYWILTNKRTIISRTTVQHLTQDEVTDPDVQQSIRDYHSQLDMAMGIGQYNADDDIDDFIHDDVEAQVGTGLNDDGEEDLEEIPDIDEVVDNTDEEELNNSYDRYVGVEMNLPDRRGDLVMAKVIKKTRDADRNPDTGAYNPLNDHSRYEVKFTDGSTEELTANVIAENMMAGCDSEGHHFQLIEEISDHKKDGSAIKISDGYITSRSGKRTPKKTTRGWKLLVEWKDHSVDWIPLKDLKASNPIELAEYALANGLEEEPAFKWWVRSTLRQRDRMIAKVKTKYWRTSHKFGIRVPKSVTEAYDIDRQTGTDFWTKAILKEMKNVRVAFDKVDGVTEEEMKTGKIKPGYKFCGTHMIFDIKMDGKFTRKARLVADGHKTDPPSSITYSSVVSRDSVRIGLTMASLNGLDVFACDIGNAYLNANCRERLWTVAGPEFGSESGSIMIIVRALYGLKSSGAAWRSKLAETLRGMLYFPSESDPDVWLKRDTKPDGMPYWKYMLIYVDDVLHIAHNPSVDMKSLNEVYRLKEGAGPPDRYLGANVEQVQLEDGRLAWSMTCVDYLRGAIEGVNNTLQESGTALKNFGKGERPYPSSYKPELDTTPELNEKLANRYQQYIGILRWSIELGRIDIMTEVSCLSQFLCNPREGHLSATYKIFRYLQATMSRNPGRIAFDGSYSGNVDERLFANGSMDPGQWEDFYPDAREALPGKRIEPLGNPVRLRCYVDANHAGNMANRRSHSGVIIYINNAPIIWYSKRQNTVESSSFGSEYVALRIATELIETLRYKLRTFGIPVDGPCDVFCDNKSVVTNSSVPSSALNKRHNAICYHKVREAGRGDDPSWLD